VVHGRTPIRSPHRITIPVNHCNINFDFASFTDRTPMHLAAENGHANIIELLVDKFKASIYERTKDGSTLMHIASLNGHADCAMMLFKKGVYLHMPNKSGARSIHTAARYGHVGIINTLLQKGEKVDVTTNVRAL